MKYLLTLLCLPLAVLSAHRLSAQNWEAVSYNGLPANFEFQAVSVVSDQIVWIVADSLFFNNGVPPVDHRPVVMRTLDGGQSWDYRRVEEAVGRAGMDIIGFDANTAIMSSNKRLATDDRPIFRTTDGGLSWDKITPPNKSGGLVLHFFDVLNGLAANRFFFSTTSDGGETWTQVPAANTPPLVADEYNLLFNAGNFSAQVGDRVWMGTSKGRVMRTIDRGQHWEAYQAADTSETIISVAFTDSLHGVAVVPGTATTFYEQSKLFGSADGGKTWSPLPGSPLGLTTTVAAVPGAFDRYWMGTHYYMPSSHQALALNAHVPDSTGWNIHIDSFLVNAMDFLSPSSGYVAGYSIAAADTFTLDGYTAYTNVIYKWNGNLTPALEKPVAPAMRLSLSPNPATDLLQFDFEGFSAARGALAELMDAQGKTLWSKQVFEKTLSLVDLPEGAYVLKISTDQGSLSTPFIKH